jgi:hypothetical protein
MANIRTGNNILGTEFRRFAVYADFVFLDTTERRQFAQNAHEYLIEQVQVLESVSSINIKLPFNHPVKELIWTRVPLPVGGNTRDSVVPGGASPSRGFSPSTISIPNTYTLILNGQNRFAPRDITYFTRNQVWDTHTGFGSILFPDSVAVYSFALRPEDHQPSGTCNFSRIELAQLLRSQQFVEGGNTPAKEFIDVYAVNYNILRIMNGLGGVAYSN